jgi:hypothetical protein
MTRPDDAAPADTGSDALLAIYFIDLRAEIEAELRILTDTQRQLERYRSLSAARKQTKGLLTRQLKQMLATNVSIREALEEAQRLVAALAE